MPLKKAERPRHKTPLDLIVEQEVAELGKLLDELKGKRRSRILELATKNRDLTASEAAELARLSREHLDAKRESRKRQARMAKLDRTLPAARTPEEQIRRLARMLDDADIRAERKAKKAEKKRLAALPDATEATANAGAQVRSAAAAQPREPVAADESSEERPDTPKRRRQSVSVTYLPLV